jgi:hypothetical protein
MIIVAIAALGSPVEAEAPAFARDTGLALYEARLRLLQPAPIIALRTADREAALRMLASLRARGHDAVACDDAAVPEPNAVRDLAALPSPDAMVALVRAVRAMRTETTSRVTERKLRPGAAIATGGLVMSKKVTREETRIAHDKEELLYVFTKEGAAHLLSERGTVYATLEGAAATQRENFLRVVADVRARAPHAAWDERLLQMRQVDDAREVDLRAQIVAIALARKR